MDRGFLRLNFTLSTIKSKKITLGKTFTSTMEVIISTLFHAFLSIQTPGGQSKYVMSRTLHNKRGWFIIIF